MIQTRLHNELVVKSLKTLKQHRHKQVALYTDYYANDPFTHVSKQEIALKQVINSNNCFLHLHLQEGTLLITSVIDNLIKGASGQAIQNMNLIFGWEEGLGLNLKASTF